MDLFHWPVEISLFPLLHDHSKPHFHEVGVSHHIHFCLLQSQLHFPFYSLTSIMHMDCILYHFGNTSHFTIVLKGLINRPFIKVLFKLSVSLDNIVKTFCIVEKGHSYDFYFFWLMFSCLSGYSALVLFIYSFVAFFHHHLSLPH